MDNTQFQLPFDEVAEQNVLGTIIANDGMFETVEDILDSSAFHNPTNRALFRCIKYLIINKKVVDERAVIDTAKRFSGKLGVNVDELEAIYSMSMNQPESFEQDVDRIVDYGRRRRAWELLVKASQDVLSLQKPIDETITGVLKSSDEIMSSADGSNGIIDAKDAIKMVYNQINENLAGMNRDSIMTGFRFSDEKGGLRCGSLVVIGAWAGSGKSSLAMNIAVSAAKNGIPNAYYSLEMPAVELWARIVCQHTGVPSWKIASYALNRDELRCVDESVTQLQSLPIYIDDNATTRFDKMLRSVRMMVKKHGIRMFVVDYLQIFAQGSRGEKEETVLSRMARELKNISMELNVCCITLSQLRRAGEDKHPTIDMLRGSGQIEEAADNVILIDRPDAHPEWGVTKFKGDSSISVDGMAEIRVTKGRNIGTGVYYVGFDAERFQFYETDGFTSEQPTVTQEGGDNYNQENVEIW